VGSCVGSTKGRDFRVLIRADVFRRRTVEGSAVKGSIEGVGASTAYIEKGSLWENSGHAYQSVVVALARLGCFRRHSQADDWNIIALQRKRSYQFHQRWGGALWEHDRMHLRTVSYRRVSGRSLA